MRKTAYIFSVAVMVFILSASSASAGTLKVITKDNAVRQENKFFSPALIQVKYGDELEEIKKSGDWFRVRFKGKEGWIHKTAVEEKKINLSKVLGGGGQAKQDEVALAGKGFNPQVEKAYKDKHPEAKYDLVDRVEAIKVPDEELRSFIKDGGLKETE